MTRLIAGIGNRWASDDGVGPEIVRRLREQPGAAAVAKLQLATFARPDVALLDAMRGVDCLVVVDAVSGGGAPGALYWQVWDAEGAADRNLARASSHGWGVKEVLELAEELGCLPPQVWLCGVEAASTAPGEGLSPVVEAAVPAAVARLLRWAGEAA